MIGVRDTAGLAAALEAVLFTLNRPVTVLELQEILQSPLPDVEAAATALGGSLEVGPRPGGGTRLRAELPNSG